jgi:hypothetical protein
MNRLTTNPERITKLETQYETVVVKMAKQISEIYNTVRKHNNFIIDAEKKIEIIAIEKVAEHQKKMESLTL